MDFSLIIGLIVGLGGIIAGYLMDKGSLAALMLISPALIVIGGTIGATIASYSLTDITKALKAVGGSFSKKSKGDPTAVIEKISQISQNARKNGLLSIEESLKDPDFSKDEYLFLKEGLLLVLEGRGEEEIAYVLESDIRAFALQKQMEVAVFESMGGFSPTMGVLGTVMSLVVVLSGDMSDAAHLAESIATAFVATMYGVGLANILYLPIATKLKANLKRLKIQREMILDGVCMIAKGENTRNIENKLSLYYQAFPGGEKKYKAGIEN